LIHEIARYLAAVALYRELGCEPGRTADRPANGGMNGTPTALLAVASSEPRADLFV
jgi:hypothetical protein